MKEALKTAVIGCGKVGHFHARAWRQVEGCELVACWNRALPRAQAFAGDYGIRPYDDLERMVRECGVQAASICTPHMNHAGLASALAKLGVHIIVEKPLAVSLEDCDAIIAAVKESGVTGATISQRRFYEPVIRVKRAIDEGKIGKPILGTVNMLGWRSMDYYRSDPWRGSWAMEGGGVLVNQAVHQLDLLLWYMGEVDSLFGIWDTLNHPELEVDDTAAAVIRFKSGAIGSICVSNCQNPALFGNVRVHGYNGASVGVQTDGGAMFIAGVSGAGEPPVNDLWTVPGEEDLLPRFREEDRQAFLAADDVRYFKLQLEDFARAIREGRAPLVTLEDGRRAVELFQGIYRSHKEGRKISFPLQ